MNFRPQDSARKVYKKSPSKLLFENELAAELRILRFSPFTFETVAETGRFLQSTPTYVNLPEIQELKFSRNFISRFIKAHGFRWGPEGQIFQPENYEVMAINYGED